MNCSQPVVVDDANLFISSAPGPGAALLEITRMGQGYAGRPVWQNNRMKNKFNSSVLYQGCIYGFDEAILACVDARIREPGSYQCAETAEITCGGGIHPCSCR